MKSIRLVVLATVMLASGWAAAQSCPTPLVVDTTADSGCGSLRNAINFSNGGICNSVSPTITFNPGSGTLVIKPLTPLPPIQCDTTIDGGGTPNTNPTDVTAPGAGSSDAIFNVQIDGSQCVDIRTAACDGLVGQVFGVTIRGLSIHSFVGNGVVADGFVQVGLEGNLIADNGNGVYLNNGGWVLANPNGDSEGLNVISGNRGAGIFVDTDGALMDITGNIIDGNAGDGVTIVGDNFSSAVSAIFQDNFIRNNVGAGIISSLQEVQVTHNIIAGNGGNALDYTFPVTPSDLPTPPQIDSWTFDGTTLTVNVSSDASAQGSDVDIFSNPNFNVMNLPMVQEGQKYVGVTTLGTLDANGRAVGQLTVTPGTDIAFPTATATESCTCQTSEYSDSVLPPLAEVHGGAPISVGAQGTVTVQVQNGNSQLMDRITFSYALPSPLTLGSGSVTSTGCGTSVTPTANGFNVSNLALSGGAICTVNVPATSPLAGSKPTGNTSDITSSLGTGGTIESTNLLVTQPLITSDTPVVDFGNVNVGTPASMTVTLSSTGDESLVIGTLAANTTVGGGTPFTLSNDNCSGRTLPAFVSIAVTCTVDVGFAPTAVVGYSGTLSIPSNAGTLTIPLLGDGSAPVLQVTPNPVAFGNVTAGLTPTIDVTLKNTGNADMTLFLVNVTNTAGTAFSDVGTTCGVTIAPNSTCTVTIAFAPSAVTSYSGSLNITANLLGPTTVSVPLSGAGIVAPPTVSPASIAFGNVPAGGAASSNVTITNNAAISVPVAVSLAGSGFTLGNTCGASLPPGGFCTATVTFLPTSAIGYSGTLQVVSSIATPTTVSVPISGNGTVALIPVLTRSPASLTFGLQAVGTTSAAQSVTVTNTGNTGLNIGTVTLTGADFGASGCGGQTLAPNASCTIAVTFTPGSTGAKSGSISIPSNDAASPATVTLSGNGGAPAVQLSPGAVSFPRQTIGSTSPAQVVTLTNTGDTALHISSIAISGDFNYSGCGFPLTLAPGVSCTFSITFSPIASGLATGQIDVTSDAPKSPHTIALSGTGASGPQPGIALRPFALGFGDVQVGAQAVDRVTIESNGVAPLHIASIDVSGVGFAQSNACPATLAVGASCDVTITFSPGSLGAFSGQLTVRSDGDPAAFNASLAGNGVATPPAVLSVGLFVDFGQHVIGTSTPLPLQLRNTGGQRLDISSIAITGAAFALHGDCGSIASGDSCVVTLVFQPATAATFTGVVSIRSNDGRGTVNVNLLGQGVAAPRPEVDVSVDGIGFANQLILTESTPGQTFQVMSVGTAALQVRGISVTGAFNVRSSCPASLTPGQHCDVRVTFLPLARGAAVGRVTIDTDDPSGLAFVSLTGTGCSFFATPGERSLVRLCSP